uniref:Perlucin n=1 Tax=Culex pipiens TaxID=7175 RepID=A0A8D8NAE4_CULPI
MLKASSLLAMLAIVSSSLQHPVDSEDSQVKFVIPRFMTNWYGAVEYCNLLGLRLAVIEDREKSSKVYAAVEASDIYVEAKTPVWLGASDLANEGYFHWHATGKRVFYSNWADGQPNNLGGGEHCMEATMIGDTYYGFKWLWNDLNCSAAQYFVCEEIVKPKYSLK